MESLEEKLLSKLLMQVWESSGDLGGGRGVKYLEHLPPRPYSRDSGPNNDRLASDAR